MDVLTPAGLALCVALTGNPAPPTDDCVLAFMRTTPSCDAWGRCPAFQDNSPDVSYSPPAGYQCEAVGTYDIFDGSKGTTRLCRRTATIIWLPDGRWAWEFEP